MNGDTSAQGWMQSRLLRLVVSFVVLALCVRYVIRTFAWGDIMAIVSAANVLVFIVGSCFTLLAYWALRAWRWKVLLQTIGAVSLPWRTLYLSTSCSLAFAIVTPFQSGEALKVELLGRHGNLGKFDGYSCLAIERVLDLLSILLLAMIGLALSAAHGSGLSIATLLLAALVLVIGTASVAWWAVAYSPWQARFKPLLGSLLAAPGRLLFAWMLSLGGWLVLAVGWHECLRSIGIGLSALQSLSLTASITLINVLSLVPGAVGVSETGIAVALAQMGHTSSMAQSGALMIRAYGLMALVLGLVHYVVWRLLFSGKTTSISRA
jgi:uncharacterized membrane protein YbhN (UPF0104 family)